jgi:hypothetical protein
MGAGITYLHLLQHLALAVFGVVHEAVPGPSPLHAVWVDLPVYALNDHGLAYMAVV